jgi:hypothetical protein
MRILVFVFILFSSVNLSAGPLLNSYLPHMNTVQDWKRISWADQVRVTEEVAAEAGIKDEGAPINACMDRMASDVRSQGFPFNLILQKCVEAAKKRQ